jgi:hypothetical protein
METILTVLSTIGVVALAFAFSGVIRLSRRVEDLELIRMEVVDIESKIEKHIENKTREREGVQEDIYKRIDKWNSSIDRRFDNVWTVIHTIDKIVNPSKDKIK